MSSERGGLLKMRAEEFARHLQRRLRSLGGGEEADGTWAGGRHSDTEVYFDIDSTSPQEELPEPIFISAQNRDNLPLQRSESSGSEYFDSFEELPPSSSTVPNQKKIPILHLKTEKLITLTNGHTNIIDADLGCSRVHVISCGEIQPCVSENSVPVEENCDSIVENNNSWKEIEDVMDKVKKIDLEPTLTHCNGDSVSLETLPGTYSDEVVSNPEGELVGNTNCVFCDIEQAKSSFTISCEEPIVSATEEVRNKKNINHSADKEPDKHLDVPVHPFNEGSSDAEESVPLKDLLQVLKREISKENDINEGSEVDETNEREENSQSDCPNIEVRESTPTSTDRAGSEDKEEEFDIEARRKNFRRCSSLKCGKTPPGTPGRKKIVRFADVLGLDLTDIKTFLDEVPTVPKSAYSDLHLQPDPDPLAPSVTPPRNQPAPQTRKVLVSLFQQPFLCPNFMDRVMSNNVCLESASVSDMSLFAITGVVRVRNIDFHKSVYVRYSINSWKSYSDLQARYIPNSCDGFSDKFSFVLYAHTLSVSQKLEFAVRYHTSGSQFWDSNGGLNYIFECIQQPVSQAFTTPEIISSPVEICAAFL